MSAMGRLVAMSAALMLSGCTNFIDGISGMSNLNYDSAGNAYVPTYPDMRKEMYSGSGNCTATVVYGRRNNNVYAQAQNTGPLTMKYTMFWSDQSVDTGQMSPGSFGVEHIRINPNIVPLRIEAVCT